MGMLGFGPSREELAIVNEHHATSMTALVSLLVEKGVFTDEEFIAARIKATHFVEQEVARRTEEAAAELEKAYPGQAEKLRKFLGNPADA